MKLSEMREMENGVVLKVGGEGEIHRRLLDMGLVKGARFTMIRVAPLGDPLDIFIKGFHLSLRKSEAGFIEVENLGVHPGAGFPGRGMGFGRMFGRGFGPGRGLGRMFGRGRRCRGGRGGRNRG